MLSIDIPGYKKLTLHQVVINYNGTLAVDGKVKPEVSFLLNALSQHLFVHIVTSDEFNTAESELSGINGTLTILSEENLTIEKQKYLQQFNADETVMIGNGRDDRYALKDAALGIAVLAEEGMAIDVILAADLVSPSMLHALDLLLNPQRLVNTLRS